MINFTNARRKLSDLMPMPNNPRRLTDAQAKHLKASLTKFNLAEVPVINTNNTIIAGHQRVRIMQMLHGDIEIDVRIPERLMTQEEVDEYNIRSNANTGEWDWEILGNQWDAEKLKEWGMEGVDFGIEEQEGLTDPDAVPEAPIEPVSKLGDLWFLGNHKLKCGDSTSADDVGHLLGAVKPHLMVTDPPYGVNYDADWRNKALREDGTPIGGRAVGKVKNDDRADWSEAWALFPGDVCYVWHADKKAHVVAESLLKNDLEIRAQIIWAKNNIVISRGHYHPKHEPCWYAVKKKAKNAQWNGDRKQSTVWEIDKPMKSETGHSTQKPVECMKRPMENNSRQGQAVYDPFLGSGTSIIAAEMTGRHCYGLELSPAYCDVIIKRWQDFTGEKAVRDDGVKFDDLQVTA